MTNWMKDGLRARAWRILALFLSMGLALSPPSPARADEDDAIEAAGDILQFVLPLSAIGSTFIAGNPEGGMWDKEGTRQYALSFGSAIATSSVWKFIASKTRPNGASKTSYPSGHSTAAFSGGTFIEIRYGGIWGKLAVAAAAFTGYSRVYSDWHFADDVIAGASVGLMWNWFWATPQPKGVTVMPRVGEEGTGVEVSIVPGAGDGVAAGSGDGARIGVELPRWRYEFVFGGAFMQSNQIAAGGSGTRFDLDTFDKTADPLTTAVARLTYRLNDRHQLSLQWYPYELRDTGTLTGDVRFGGADYPAGSEVGVLYRLNDIRAVWLYDVLPGSSWKLGLGAGAMFQDTYVRLLTADQAVDAAVEDVAMVPIAHVHAGYELMPNLELLVFVEGIGFSGEYVFDASAILNYRLSREWDVSAGYSYYGREIETNELTNKTRYDALYLSLAYSL